MITKKPKIIIFIFLIVLISTAIIIYKILYSNNFDSYNLPKGKLYETLALSQMIIHIAGDYGDENGGGYLRIETPYRDNNSRLTFFDSHSIPSQTQLKYIDDHTILVNDKKVDINEVLIYR